MLSGAPRKPRCAWVRGEEGQEAEFGLLELGSEAGHVGMGLVGKARGRGMERRGAVARPRVDVMCIGKSSKTAIQRDCITAAASACKSSTRTLVLHGPTPCIHMKVVHPPQRDAGQANPDKPATRRPFSWLVLPCIADPCAAGHLRCALPTYVHFLARLSLDTLRPVRSLSPSIRYPHVQFAIGSAAKVVSVGFYDPSSKWWACKLIRKVRAVQAHGAHVYDYRMRKATRRSWKVATHGTARTRACTARLRCACILPYDEHVEGREACVYRTVVPPVLPFWCRRTCKPAGCRGLWPLAQVMLYTHNTP